MPVIVIDLQRLYLTRFPVLFRSLTFISHVVTLLVIRHCGRHHNSRSCLQLALCLEIVRDVRLPSVQTLVATGLRCGSRWRFALLSLQWWIS